MTYPDEFLKGIPNDQFIDEDGRPASNLFCFDPKHQKNNRGDDFLEESICWRDDREADELLFNQMKNDKIQFKAGVAVMCRVELKRIIKKTSGTLSYERNELEYNRYHGNLLLKKTVEKREMKKISTTIAFMCSKIILSNTNM